MVEILESMGANVDQDGAGSWNVQANKLNVAP